MDKSVVAFQLNVEHLFEDGHNVYFWTWTFKRVHNVDDAMARWSNFCRELARVFSVKGVRVVEKHPGGHGLHFHAMIEGRIPIGRVRRIGRRFGFGRDKVLPAEKNSWSYLAKYLSKARPALLRGRRLWDTIGEGEWTKVCNVKIKSWVGDRYRELKPRVFRFVTAKSSRSESWKLLMECWGQYFRWLAGAEFVGVEEDGVRILGEVPERADGVPFCVYPCPFGEADRRRELANDIREGKWQAVGFAPRIERSPILVSNRNIFTGGGITE